MEDENIILLVKEACIKNVYDDLPTSVHYMLKIYDTEKVLYFFNNKKLIYIHKTPYKKYEFHYDHEYTLSDSDSNSE